MTPTVPPAAAIVPVVIIVSPPVSTPVIMIRVALVTSSGIYLPREGGTVWVYSPRGMSRGPLRNRPLDLSWEVFHSFSSCLIIFVLFRLMLCEIKGITANYRQNDALDSSNLVDALQN